MIGPSVLVKRCSKDTVMNRIRHPGADEFCVTSTATLTGWA